jgi:hypothetical protein
MHDTLLHPALPCLVAAVLHCVLQVLLWSQCQPRVPLVYASSWWASASVDK